MLKNYLKAFIFLGIEIALAFSGWLKAFLELLIWENASPCIDGIIVAYCRLVGDTNMESGFC